GYTHVDWKQRKKLGNNNLAKWLHGFYSTHASPFDYKVETIRDLCGSNPSQRLGDFRKLLRAALKKLKDQGSILDWKIDPKTDLLSVWRKPSASQHRHLQKKLAAAEATVFDSRETF
uniref:plasmid replication initiator TrfA n=1 Tax=Streptomyces cyaneofuscatus TaxID=66883 RepID=UPI002FF144DF